MSNDQQLIFTQDCEIVSYLGFTVDNVMKKINTTINNSAHSFCSPQIKMKEKMNLTELTYINSGNNAAIFSFPNSFKTNDVLLRLTFNSELNGDEYRGLYYQGIIAYKCHYVNRILDLGTYQTNTELSFGQHTSKKGTGIYAVLENAPKSFKSFIEYIRSIENVNERNKTKLITIIQLLQAFQCIHSLGYVHFDLKPENVQFDEKFKNIKIIDFGFCRKFGEEIINPHGTPAYMSPLNKKGTTVSGYLDFYSIGIMIWLIWYGLDDVDCLYKINFIRNKLSQSPYAKPTQDKLDNNCKGITPDNIKDLVGSKDNYDYVDEFMKKESNYSIKILQLNKTELNYSYFINELIKWMENKLSKILKDAKSVGGKRKSLRRRKMKLKNKSSKNRYSNRRNKSVRKR